MLKEVVSGEPLSGYRLTLGDGAKGTGAARQLIQFTGVFEPLRDQADLKQIRVNAELGTVGWPNGANLDPDGLYATVTNTVYRYGSQKSPRVRGGTKPASPDATGHPVCKSQSGSLSDGDDPPESYFPNRDKA